MTIRNRVYDAVGRRVGNHHRSVATVKQLADPANQPRPMSKGEMARALDQPDGDV